MRTLTIVTHFHRDDPKFLSDYAYVDVILDGKLAATWGDASHERGLERAEGFQAGVVAALNGEAVVVTRERVADYD